MSVEITDFRPFDKLSYGVYLISTKDGGASAGCVANTLAQVTVTPVQLTVALHKDNYTTQLIERSGVFAATALAQSASMELIGTFGFQSSREINKFANLQTQTDLFGVPYVSEQSVSQFSCKVVGTMDAGTHLIFLGDVQQARLLEDVEPMTYAYYHLTKKGLAPPKASSYRPPKKTKGYRCKICGYILESDTLPEDYICPVCKRGAEVFEPIMELE